MTVKNTDDLNDPLPLTPNDFLAAEDYAPQLAEPGPAATQNSRKGRNLVKEFEHVQRLMDHFWNRLATELFPSLHDRSKWTTKRPEPKVGDVVISLDGRVRGRWPLARVTELHPSPRDGVVRHVTLKMGSGATLKRSVRSIGLLPIEPAQI